MCWSLTALDLHAFEQTGQYHQTVDSEKRLGLPAGQGIGNICERVFSNHQVRIWAKQSHHFCLCHVNIMPPRKSRHQPDVTDHQTRPRNATTHPGKAAMETLGVWHKKEEIENDKKAKLE
jgi:hypothetical protein